MNRSCDICYTKIIYVDCNHNIWSLLTLIELITKKGNFRLHEIVSLHKKEEIGEKEIFIECYKNESCDQKSIKRIFRK